jgi:hypothetical protein
MSPVKSESSYFSSTICPACYISPLIKYNLFHTREIEVVESNVHATQKTWQKGTHKRTSLGTVAENRSVCLSFGNALIIPSRLFRNPMSNNWSASSRTKTFKSCNCLRTSGFDWIWSSSLPGVPTRIYNEEQRCTHKRLVIWFQHTWIAHISRSFMDSGKPPQ